MSTQTSSSMLINGFGLLFVILNAFGLGLRLEVGKQLALALAHWKIAVWALVVNFVVIPLLFIGYLLTVASSIPGEIKVGFCVAALCAGMPFAPLLANLAKADVSVSTTLLVVLTVVTIIALPLGLPPAVHAVDSSLTISVWSVAWPLLLFLLLPLVLGCAFRVWWPDLTPPSQQWVVRISILCLLFNLNFTLFAYWSLFVKTWGTYSYIAAIAGPFIGLGCAYLLVSGLRVKDVGIRHATEVTTAVRNIAPMLLMMIFPFRADPLVTVSITILNTVGIVTVLLFVLMWRRVCLTVGPSRINRPASDGIAIRTSCFDASDGYPNHSRSRAGNYRERGRPPDPAEVRIATWDAVRDGERVSTRRAVPRPWLHRNWKPCRWAKAEPHSIGVIERRDPSPRPPVKPRRGEWS